MADEQVVEETTSETKEAPKQTQDEPLTLEAVKKMIQSETDRVRTEYSRKLKDVEAEKEELEKERMTEKQRAEYELAQEKKRQSETAAQLAQRELALERANVITEMQIPKDLAPFVNGKDRDEIANNAKNLMRTFDAEVLKGINKKLATSGNAPETGDQESTPSYEMADWKKIWAMKPGRDKDEALEKAFESLKGQKIPVQGRD